MKVKFSLLFFLCAMFLGSSALAANRYMATTGADTGDCSSEAQPCLTLQYAMSKMSGSDTLIIDDGDYTSAKNSIDHNHIPPSGTSSAFTVIRAKNIPCQNGISCDQPLKVRFSGSAVFKAEGTGVGSPSYVKFWGIRWNGIQTYANWNHIIFKQIASQGVQDGNNIAITVGGRYTLLEDVVAFGKGRYKIMFYDYSRESQTWGTGHNLCRRCVIRQDWSMKNDTQAAEPLGGIVSYFNRGSACLNCIVIDSDTPSDWQDASSKEIVGAYAQVVDNGAHAFIVKGSMAVNSAYAAYNNRQGSSGHVISDFLALKVAGGFGVQGDTDISRVTIVNASTKNFTYRSTGQESEVLAPNDGFYSFNSTAKTLKDSIISGTYRDGVRGSGFTSDYLNLFDIGGSNFTSSTAAPHLFTTDPLSNGLKYPVRIEEGSALYTQGSTGGQIGARIVNKLGVDGTFKNETNWDTEQSSPLWPWPLEEWIRAEMKTSEYTVDPNRGFCATGETLTNYIWGFLGNTAPPFGTESLAGSGKATLIWDQPVNTSTITGFKIYNVTSGSQVLAASVSGNATFHKVLTGLTNNKTYKFVVTAVDSVKGESGPSEIITVTPKSLVPMPPTSPSVK